MKKEEQVRNHQLSNWLNAPGSPAAAAVIQPAQARRFPDSEAQQRKSTNMAPKLELPSAVAIAWLIFLSLVPPAEAYDAGDALALILGTIVSVVGFCACLGWYARRRNGQL